MLLPFNLSSKKDQSYITTSDNANNDDKYIHRWYLYLTGLYTSQIYILHTLTYVFLYILETKKKKIRLSEKKATTEVNGEYMHFNLRNLRTHPHTLYSFTAIMHKVCINTSKSSKAVLSKQHLSFTYVSTQISIQN